MNAIRYEYTVLEASGKCKTAVMTRANPPPDLFVWNILHETLIMEAKELEEK